MELTTQFTVLQWLTQLDRLVKDNRCNGPNCLRPYHFVTLALTMHQHRAQALTIPEKLRSYAYRMQLWQAIGLEPPMQKVLTPPATGQFLPTARIDNKAAVPDLAKALARITGRYGADAETEDAVFTSMSEMLENCFAHAAIDGALKGLVCAQSWPGSNLAQIAIADCGVGIRSSLLENLEYTERLKEENSCEMATQFGVTSKPQLGHAGYGMALTRQLLEHSGGRLIVLSGNEWMQARGLRTSTGTMEIPWNGTIAVLEWRTNFPMSLKRVYESWPLPAGITDDDLGLENLPF